MTVETDNKTQISFYEIWMNFLTREIIKDRRNAFFLTFESAKKQYPDKVKGSAPLFFFTSSIWSYAFVQVLKDFKNNANKGVIRTAASGLRNVLRGFKAGWWARFKLWRYTRKLNKEFKKLNNFEHLSPAQKERKSIIQNTFELLNLECAKRIVKSNSRIGRLVKKFHDELPNNTASAQVDNTQASQTDQSTVVGETRSQSTGADRMDVGESQEPSMSLSALLKADLASEIGSIVPTWTPDQSSLLRRWGVISPRSDGSEQSSVYEDPQEEVKTLGDVFSQARAMYFDANQDEVDVSDLPKRMHDNFKESKCLIQSISEKDFDDRWSFLIQLCGRTFMIQKLTFEKAIDLQEERGSFTYFDEHSLAEHGLLTKEFLRELFDGLFEDELLLEDDLSLFQERLKFVDRRLQSIKTSSDNYCNWYLGSLIQLQFYKQSQLPGFFLDIPQCNTIGLHDASVRINNDAVRQDCQSGFETAALLDGSNPPECLNELIALQLQAWLGHQPFGCVFSRLPDNFKEQRTFLNYYLGDQVLEENEFNAVQQIRQSLSALKHNSKTSNISKIKDPLVTGLIDRNIIEFLFKDVEFKKADDVVLLPGKIVSKLNIIIGLDQPIDIKKIDNTSASTEELTKSFNIVMYILGLCGAEEGFRYIGGLDLENKELTIREPSSPEAYHLQHWLVRITEQAKHPKADLERALTAASALIQQIRSSRLASLGATIGMHYYKQAEEAKNSTNSLKIAHRMCKAYFEKLNAQANSVTFDSDLPVLADWHALFDALRYFMYWLSKAKFGDLKTTVFQGLKDQESKFCAFLLDPKKECSLTQSQRLLMVLYVVIVYSSKPNHNLACLCQKLLDDTVQSGTQEWKNLLNQAYKEYQPERPRHSVNTQLFKLKRNKHDSKPVDSKPEWLTTLSDFDLSIDYRNVGRLVNEMRSYCQSQLACQVDPVELPVVEPLQSLTQNP